MGLYDRFELLEMRHNDGVQTYHAREIATARPVQVHFLSNSIENRALLAGVNGLSESEHRRVLDQGEIQGIPYVVTDRLSGYATFREWLAAQAPAPVRGGIDAQFWTLFDAGQANAGHVNAAPALEKAAEAAVQGSVYLEKEAEPWESQSNPTLRTNIHVVPSAARLTLGLVVGIVAAVLFLVLALAIFAFRSH